MAKIVNTSVEHLNKLMEALVDIATAAPVGPWTATESSGYNNPSVSTPDGPLFQREMRDSVRTPKGLRLQFTWQHSIRKW